MTQNGTPRRHSCCFIVEALARSGSPFTSLTVARDRHPLEGALRVHREREHLVDRGVDLDGDLDDAHRAATLPGSRRSHSRSARLDGAVEAVQAHAEERPARVVVARQDVAAQRAHERLDEPGVLAGDRGGDAAGDRRSC